MKRSKKKKLSLNTLAYWPSPLPASKALPQHHADTVRWDTIRSHLRAWLAKHPEAQEDLIASLVAELEVNDDTPVQP